VADGAILILGFCWKYIDCKFVSGTSYWDSMLTSVQIFLTVSDRVISVEAHFKLAATPISNFSVVKYEGMWPWCHFLPYCQILCECIKCELKNSPLRTCGNFSKTVRNFSTKFTCLLCVPIYARIRIFIQLSATLTKLCHIKRDHHNVLKMSTIRPQRTLGGRT